MMKATRSKFDIRFDVIEGGSGQFFGALEDIQLAEGATITWVAPRRILKAPSVLHLKAGMVIQTPTGVKYMVAEHAISETSQGSPFNAFKLYQTNSVAQLVKRSTITDIRTGLEKEGPESEPISIYVSYEPLQEAFDRQLRIPNEKTRMITNHPIKRGDIIDGEAVIEVHDALGLYGAILA
jgi:hypothetical protein